MPAIASTRVSARSASLRAGRGAASTAARDLTCERFAPRTGIRAALAGRSDLAGRFDVADLADTAEPADTRPRAG